VLFIAVDDLRPELGCMGADYAITPNIDRLARSGRLFTRHYVQVPTCGASRFALLTGRSPAESKALRNDSLYHGKTALKQKGNPAGAQSMPELFRNSGYHTVCIGKVSHNPDGKVFAYDGSGDGRPELPKAWDEFLTPYGQWKRGWGIFFAYEGGRHREDGSGFRPVMQSPDVGDSDLPDGMLADAAIAALKANKDRRFFIGLGFIKPHLPFVAPKKYWDLYEKVDIPLAANPKKTSAYSHRSGECYGYQFPFKKSHPLADKDARKMRRAYLACVSYTDAQIGRVLDQLDALGLSDNTIVVLWGDHGWHLGDNQIWGKHSPLDYALNSPLIIRTPNMPNPGKQSTALVETIDIYPTLIDVCNPADKSTATELAGNSIRPILENPQAPGRNAALSYWNNCTSIRTDAYRLILPTGKSKKPIELYDHRTDPEEARNIATTNPETVSTIKKLAQQKH
jgi:arylsulfatase A-like enzyme